MQTTDARTKAHRPVALWPLLAAMTFLCLGGFSGGLAMITDPTGASLGADLGWLRRTPVGDFLLPGFFVFAVYGCAVAACIVGLLRRIEPGPTRRFGARLGQHWAWAGTIAIGAVLVLWIVFEFFIITDISWLQPTLLGVGAVMIGVPWFPSMRSWYSIPGAAGA